MILDSFRLDGRAIAARTTDQLEDVRYRSDPRPATDECHPDAEDQSHRQPEPALPIAAASAKATARPACATTTGPR